MALPTQLVIDDVAEFQMLLRGIHAPTQQGEQEHPE